MTSADQDGLAYIERRFSTSAHEGAHEQRSDWSVRPSTYLVMELAQSNAALRAAMEAVEWVWNNHDANVCPWCERTSFDGHTADCQRQRALGLRSE